MKIRMLQKGPSKVSYGGFDYRVEPMVSDDATTSKISARLLAATGRLWEPFHEQDLTPNFLTADGAANSWSTGFAVDEKYFLQREIVSRLIEEGSAAEIEEVAAPAPVRVS